MDRLGKDVLFHIATMLDLDDLLSLCKSGKEMNKLICLEKFIWNHRLKYEFPDWEKNINREKLHELLSLIKNDVRFNILIDSKQQFRGPFDTEDKSEFERNVYLLLVKLSKLKNEIGYQGSIYQLFNGDELIINNFKINFLNSTNDRALKVLPSEIGLLINLRVLILSWNLLKTLPSEIGLLTNLKKLHLDENKIETLPHEISLLTNLEELFLQNNKITTLPPEIGALTKLRVLYLHGNQMKTLPPEIGFLTNLQELVLYDNPIEVLPPEIASLANLREIVVGKRVKNFPSNLKPTLKRIIL